MRGCTFTLSSSTPFGSKSLWASGAASASKSSTEEVDVGESGRTSFSSRGSFVLSLIVVYLGVMRSEYLDSQRYKIIARLSCLSLPFSLPDFQTRAEVEHSHARVMRARPSLFVFYLHAFTHLVHFIIRQSIRGEGFCFRAFTQKRRMFRENRFHSVNTKRQKPSPLMQ